jgi:syntaxin-binding protein 5
LSHRKPPVTAIAIHPTGHFFVVGHADGSLAFWAVEDHERPLLVRTLDEVDVNVVNTEVLDKHISQERTNKGSLQSDREPIFKLSWSALSKSSDSRGGETALTIFGGLHMNQATGITVHLFPAFNSRETMSALDQKLLHPYMRTAMRDSLDHLKTFFHYTRGIVQDYLLIPRENPHFSGTSDPIAILLLTEGTGGSRVVDAFQFPPPEFSIPLDAEGDSDENKKDPMDALDDDLASTLRSLQISDDPKRLQLPSALMNGSSGLLNGQLLKVETDTYQTLVDGISNDEFYLPLEGGLAWADDTKRTELKLSKVSNCCAQGILWLPSSSSINPIV